VQIHLLHVPANLTRPFYDNSLPNVNDAEADLNTLKNSYFSQKGLLKYYEFSSP
jgi:hypothetical protein